MSITVPQEQLAKDTDDFFTLAEKIKNIVHYGGTKESYDILLKLVNDAESYNEPVKTLLINNLKSKGISAVNTETMTALVNKINNIKLGQGNAVESDVIAGKTFTNTDGILRTGNIPIRTFAANNNSYINAISAKGDNSGSLCIVPQTGYYIEEKNSNQFGPILAWDGNFKPENILNGKSIFGVNGNAETMPSPTPGNTIIVSSDSVRTIEHTQTTDVIMKEIKVNKSGSYRVFWTSQMSNDWNYYRYYVYVNNTPVTVTYGGSATANESTVDVTVNAGDYIRIKGCNVPADRDSPASWSVWNFRLGISTSHYNSYGTVTVN